jgi:hypothetical protein
VGWATLWVIFSQSHLVTLVVMYRRHFRGDSSVWVEEIFWLRSRCDNTRQQLHSFFGGKKNLQTSAIVPKAFVLESISLAIIPENLAIGQAYTLFTKVCQSGNANFGTSIL